MWRICTRGTLSSYRNYHLNGHYRMLFTYSSLENEIDYFLDSTSNVYEHQRYVDSIDYLYYNDMVIDINKISTDSLIGMYATIDDSQLEPETVHVVYGYVDIPNTLTLLPHIREVSQIFYKYSCSPVLGIRDAGIELVKLDDAIKIVEIVRKSKSAIYPKHSNIQQYVPDSYVSYFSMGNIDYVIITLDDYSMNCLKVVGKYAEDDFTIAYLPYILALKTLRDHKNAL